MIWLRNSHSQAWGGRRERRQGYSFGEKRPEVGKASGGMYGDEDNRTVAAGGY